MKSEEPECGFVEVKTCPQLAIRPNEGEAPTPWFQSYGL